jgi:hypothetical protein
LDSVVDGDRNFLVFPGVAYEKTKNSRFEIGGWFRARAHKYVSPTFTTRTAVGLEFARNHSARNYVAHVQQRAELEEYQKSMVISQSRARSPVVLHCGSQAVQPKLVVCGTTELLLANKIAFVRLHGDMAQEKLNLLQLSSREMTQARVTPPQVMGSEA